MPARKKARKLDKTKIEGLRAGLYCRVSKQKDKHTTVADKSTDDQETLGRDWAEHAKVKIASIYADVDKSASRFARKPRENFERMLEDVKDGKLDILWFWSLDRSARNLGVFIDLRDICRDYGVLIVVRDQIYDPGHFADMLGQIIMALVAEGESEGKSEASARGQESNAKAGLPYGPLIYGHKRVYTEGPPGRRLHESLKAQIPDGMLTDDDDAISLLISADPETGRRVFSLPSDDMLAVDSPAAIVREIFRRYASGESYGTIAHDLNRRGRPPARKPGHARASDNPVWSDQSVSQILRNPHHAGLRVHQGKVLPDVDGQWVPLIDRELYWAVQERMDGNYAYRAGRGPYMLASTVRCYKCGGTLDHAASSAKRGKPRSGYGCHSRGCHAVWIQREPLDQYVEDKMVLFLSDPAIFAAMAQAGTSEEAAKARAEAAELRVKLEEVRDLFANEKISYEMADTKERKLLASIAEKDKAANEAGIPSTLLGGTIGPEAARTWAAKDVLQKREIIRQVAEITIKPIGRGRNNQFSSRTIGERVEWKWLAGPEAAEPTLRTRNRSRFEWVKPDPVPGTMTETAEGQIILAGDWTVEQKGNLARRLLDERGWSASKVALATGFERSTVSYWMRKAGRSPQRVHQRPAVRSFLAETELNHSAVARKLSVHSSVVNRACNSMVKDATVDRCVHHITESGQEATGRRSLNANADETLRARIRTFLAETELNHSAVARKLGVWPTTVGRTCQGMVDAGMIRECPHRLTETGQTVYGPKAGPRVARLRERSRPPVDEPRAARIVCQDVTALGHPLAHPLNVGHVGDGAKVFRASRPVVSEQVIPDHLGIGASAA